MGTRLQPSPRDPEGQVVVQMLEQVSDLLLVCRAVRFLRFKP